MGATLFPPIRETGVTYSYSGGSSPPSTPVSTGRMVLYGAGQVGAQIVRDSPTVLLPLFMTTMLGISPWLAGLAILIPKLWIILCDPLVGSWSDRKKASWGRAPFLMVGGPLTALGFFILFLPVTLDSEVKTAVWVSLIYTLTSTAFSAYLVPYMALASEMTTDTHERTKILAWRIVFTMVGVIAGVGFAQPLIGWAGGGAKGWTTMGGLFAVLCLVSMLAPVLVARRTVAPVSGEPQPFLAQMATAWSNPPFRALLAAFFIQSVGQAASYGAVALMFLFVLGNVTLLIPFILLMSVGSVGSQPLWVWLSRKIGKRETFTLSAFVWALLTFTWLLAKPGGPIVAHLPVLGDVTGEQILALVRAPLIGVLNAGFFLMAQSMLTDAVVYDRVRNGRSSEGALTGVFSASEKLAYAVGPFLGGIVLSAAGFHASHGGAVAQGASALRGILVNYSLVPAAFVLLSLLVIRAYHLKPADLEPSQG